eukprot:361753-Chlamydomonas_euryale.AAC.4
MAHWHVDDSLAVLERGAVGPADVAAWGAALAGGSCGARSHARALVYGNAAPSDATALAAALRRALSPGGSADAAWPCVLRLVARSGADAAGDVVHAGAASATTGADDAGAAGGEAGGAAAALDSADAVAGGPTAAATPRGLNVRYLPANPNPNNSNSAAYYVCQVGGGVRVRGWRCGGSRRRVPRAGLWVQGTRYRVLGPGSMLCGLLYGAIGAGRRAPQWTGGEEEGL